MIRRYFEVIEYKFEPCIFFKRLRFLKTTFTKIRHGKLTKIEQILKYRDQNCILTIYIYIMFAKKSRLKV